MSAETPTQGGVTTEGPEGLSVDPGAVSGATVAGPETAEAEEAYRVTAHWRPSVHTDLNDPVAEIVTGWPAARRAALKLTCLRGTIAVTVHDTDGDLVAHWDGYSNRWHEREKGVDLDAMREIIAREVIAGVCRREGHDEANVTTYGDGNTLRFMCARCGAKRSEPRDKWANGGYILPAQPTALLLGEQIITEEPK
jgi:hypothetical protein